MQLICNIASRTINLFLSRAVLGKNIWGAWPPGPYPEMWSGGRVPKAGHSNGGAEGVDGGEVWGGCILLPSGGGVWGEKFWHFLLRNGAF